MNFILEIMFRLRFFDNFRWFRKLYGGTWEQWWNENTRSFKWYFAEEYQRSYPYSRPMFCFQTYTVENYPTRNKK